MHEARNLLGGISVLVVLDALLSDLADIIAAEYKLRRTTDADLELSALEGISVEGLYIDRLATLGLEQFTLGAEQSAAFIKAELDKWAEVARSARIQID